MAALFTVLSTECRVTRCQQSGLIAHYFAYLEHRILASWRQKNYPLTFDRSGRFTRSVVWSGRADLNGRPLAPQASALPGCATPRSFSLREASGDHSTALVVHASHPSAAARSGGPAKASGDGGHASLVIGLNDSQNGLQVSPHPLDQLPGAQFAVLMQASPGPEALDSRERMSLFVEHALDLEHRFDVPLDVEALTPATLLWLQEAEFGFPEAQYRGREFCDLTDFTDFIKDLAAQLGLSRHHRPSLARPFGETFLSPSVLARIIHDRPS